ncbi:SPRY domain protein, partial [Cooperia oncophora]
MCGPEKRSRGDGHLDSVSLSTPPRNVHHIWYRTRKLIIESRRPIRNQPLKIFRALQLFGIFIEPPAHEHDEYAEKEMRARRDLVRTYRAEATYAVTKWQMVTILIAFHFHIAVSIPEHYRYFEFEILTAGFMKIGWMDVGASPDIQLGHDDRGYAFDGYLGRKWHQGAESYGKEWKIGDVVGCFLDLNDRTISFSLNGELLLDPSGSEMAFDNVLCGDGLVPAMSLGSGQRGYFTCCTLFFPFK